MISSISESRYLTLSITCVLGFQREGSINFNKAGANKTTQQGTNQAGDTEKKKLKPKYTYCTRFVVYIRQHRKYHKKILYLPTNASVLAEQLALRRLPRERSNVQFACCLKI